MNSTKTVSIITLLTLMVGCSTQHKATPQTNTLTSLSDVNKHISQTLTSRTETCSVDNSQL